MTETDTPLPPVPDRDVPPDPPDEVEAPPPPEVDDAYDSDALYGTDYYPESP